MASLVPPKRASIYTFPISLVSVGKTDVFTTTVTITSLDVMVSKDFGSFATIAAAPVELNTTAPAATGVLLTTLTALEMTADTVTVLFHDAAGAQWQDALVTIQTTTSLFDDLATSTAVSTATGLVGSVGTIVGSVGTVAGSVGTIVGSVGTVAGNTSTGVSTANSLIASVGTAVGANSGILLTGTARASTSSTIKLAASGPSDSDDIYNGMVVGILSGTGVGQCRMIYDYNGTTHAASVSRAWTTTPSTDSVYIILAAAVPRVDDDLGVFVAERHNGVLYTGTAQTGDSDSITLAAGDSTTDDWYNGCTIYLWDGTGERQSRAIVDYDGTSKVASIDRPWATNPDNTSKYSILAITATTPEAMTTATVDLLSRNTAARTWDSNRADHTQSGTFGQYAGGVSTALSTIQAVSSAVSTVTSIATGTSGGVSTATSIITTTSAGVSTATSIITKTSAGVSTVTSTVTTISAGVSTSASAVWAYSTRTLTQAAATVAATVSGATLTITIGDSLSASITGLGALTNHSKIWFTVKRSLDDADSASILQVEHAAGITYINGTAATVAEAAKGTLTVDDESAGNITVAVDETITDDLAADSGLVWGVKWLTTGGTATTLTTGTCNIAQVPTRSIA